jgi:hypothetical protein
VGGRHRRWDAADVGRRRPGDRGAALRLPLLRPALHQRHRLLQRLPRLRREPGHGLDQQPASQHRRSKRCGCRLLGRPQPGSRRRRLVPHPRHSTQPQARRELGRRSPRRYRRRDQLPGRARRGHERDRAGLPGHPARKPGAGPRRVRDRRNRVARRRAREPVPLQPAVARHLPGNHKPPLHEPGSRAAPAARSDSAGRPDRAAGGRRRPASHPRLGRQHRPDRQLPPLPERQPDRQPNEQRLHRHRPHKRHQLHLPRHSPRPGRQRKRPLQPGQRHPTGPGHPARRNELPAGAGAVCLGGRHARRHPPDPRRRRLGCRRAPLHLPLLRDNPSTASPSPPTATSSSAPAPPPPGSTPPSPTQPNPTASPPPTGTTSTPPKTAAPSGTAPSAQHPTANSSSAGSQSATPTPPAQSASKPPSKKPATTSSSPTKTPCTETQPKTTAPPPPSASNHPTATKAPNSSTTNPSSPPTKQPPHSDTPTGKRLSTRRPPVERC